MQKALLKVAFVGLLSVSSVFATESNLLSQATDGGVMTVKVVALSQAEMNEVKGGFNVPFPGITYPSYLQRLAANIRVNGR
ncbi:MAG: hypothetical protein WCW84_00685 [Sulfurimonas sp.]|jgi:hypothetical protein